MSKLILTSSISPMSDDGVTQALRMLPAMTRKAKPIVCRYQYDEDIDYLKYILYQYYFNYLQVGNYLSPFQYDNETIFERADVIFLPGGNTFQIAQMLKENGDFKKLQAFVDRGGVLIGSSAGSIIQTPTIRVAQFADDNPFDYDDLDGFNLVNFEVKPHWNSWETKKGIFKDYAKLYQTQLYGLTEGSAIVVDDDNVTMFGDVVDITQMLAAKHKEKEILNG